LQHDGAQPTKTRRWRTAAALAASAAVGLVIGAALVGRPEAEPNQTPGGGGRQDRGPPGQRAPAVTLVEVKFAAIDETLSAIGTGRAVQSLTLTADVSGVIEEILIKPGEHVETGAPLVRLQDDEQKIAVSRARADYNIARTNAARFKDLVETEAASALESEAAQNELTAATAALRQAEYELGRRTIAAPFAGIVGLTELDRGDFLAVGATVTTIDDVSSILVDFVIPESVSPIVREGFEVTAIAQASGGREVKGAVRAIDSRVDPASRTRRVEAALPNEGRGLIPGSTFSITLTAPGRKAIEAPGLSIQWDRSGAFVWRAGADGAAERVPVTILRRTSTAVLIEAALNPGDRIVAEGADQVRAGAPLRSADRDGGRSSAASKAP
jgi:RND family efflux transporter MFP subunit